MLVIRVVFKSIRDSGLSVVKQFHFGLDNAGAVHFGVQEAPDLVKTVDLLLLLDRRVFEPELVRLRNGYRFRELCGFSLLICLRLHTSALALNLGRLGVVVSHDARGSILLTLEEHSSLGSDLRQGALQLIPLSHIGQPRFRLDEIVRINTRDCRGVHLG